VEWSTQRKITGKDGNAGVVTTRKKKPRVLDFRLINRSRLARVSGVSANTIYAFFAGHRAVNFYTAMRVAEALGVTLDQLADAFLKADARGAFPELLDVDCCHDGKFKHTHT
jgi:transcriptional regulator with XRE-family HTH domain